jgi:hypothetical protein
MVVDLRGKKKITWFLPVVLDKVGEKPMMPAQVANLALPGEVKKMTVREDREVKVLKTEEERFVLVPVLVPETPDAQGEIYSHHEVEQAAHGYLAKSRQLKIMHRGRVLTDEEAQIVESYVARADHQIGDEKVVKGTWLAGFKLWSDALWHAVKRGELNSISIGGIAYRELLAA